MEEKFSSHSSICIEEFMANDNEKLLLFIQRLFNSFLRLDKTLPQSTDAGVRLPNCYKYLLFNSNFDCHLSI